MSDHVELVAAEESGDSLMELQDMEGEWEAIIRQSPGLDRLPQMVADGYIEKIYQGPDTFEKFKADVAEHVRLGLILLHRLLGTPFLDRMFQHFSKRFGEAVELLMDDVAFTYQNDKDIVENYTPAQLCGRLFALLTMIIDSQHPNENDVCFDDLKFDDVTGFNLNMNPTSLLLILARVVICAELGENGTLQCYAEGRNVVLGYVFHLKETTTKTRFH
jgi:hypothetical protein